MLISVGFAALAGCSSSGVGPAVHNDLVARLSTAQPQLSTCYAQLLARRADGRSPQGMIVLAFATAPNTGQLVDIVVSHDELRDPTMRQCVISTLSQLHLEQPTSSRVTWPSLPLRFSPQ
jgi:hypothetical protein